MDDVTRTQVAQLISGPIEFIEPEPRREPAPASSGALSGQLELIEPTPPKELTPEEKRAQTIATAKDVGMSALAEAGRSIPSMLRGAAGSTERIVGYDIPKLGRDIALSGLERADLISPAEAEKRREAPLFGRELTPEQQAGNVSPYFSQPTFKGAREELKAKPELFGQELPILAREPETPAGKIAEEATMGAVTGAPGAMRGMAGRMLTGAAAGAAGEAAGQATKGQENEPFWRLAWALGGGFLGAKAANSLLPTATARDEIAEALLRDMKTGQLRMTPEQVREAVREGRPVSLVDMAGENTLLLIEKKLGTSALNQRKLSTFNDKMKERAGLSGDRVDQTIASTIGRPVDADAYTQFLKEHGNQTRDLVFNIARSNPNADAIPNGIFGKLLEAPSVQEAMRRADISAEELTRFNIVPPKRTPAVPPTKSSWEGAGLNLREVPGTPGRPEIVTDGNLSYWHKVDQKLGDMAGEAKRKGASDEASEYLSAQKELRNRIYSVVPEYETALGVSRRTFQGESAPEAGFNFAKTLFSAAQNPFTRGEVRREFLNMPPENQEALAVGVAHFLSQKALKGDIGSLAEKFRKDENFRRDMKVVLGDDRYHQIAGSILAEDVLRRIPNISAAPSALTPERVGLGAGLATAAYENLPNILQMQMAMTPETMTKVLIAAGVGAGTKSIYSAADRRVANALVPMVFSQDPKQIMQLSRLIEGNDVARRVFNRINTTLATAYDQNKRMAERKEKEEQQRPGRATGGAVNLDALAKAAKKHVTTSTEALLNEHDDTVAKALEIANKHI